MADDVTLIHLLVECGAYVNGEALEIAYYNDNLELVKYLVKHGIYMKTIDYLLNSSDNCVSSDCFKYLKNYRAQKKKRKK